MYSAFEQALSMKIVLYKFGIIVIISILNNVMDFENKITFNLN